MRKLKLEGFNNLTKTLSLNVYYITYAETAALSFVLNNSVRKPVQLLLTMAITILLVACASFSGKTPEVTGSGNKAVSTFFFECEDQSSFVARTEDGHVWLFLESVTVNLPRRPSASGAKYQSTEYLFWSKGDEARLETAGGKRLVCANNRARAVWETAKLNGVAFRAVGNEPGWSLELGGDLLVLETDYGASRYEFRTPQADVNVDERLTRYQVTEKGQKLLLELKGQQCQDTMSGETFPTRVSVTLNGRVLQGCGRALH
jgi:uncharacterized membrane protein